MRPLLFFFSLFLTQACGDSGRPKGEASRAERDASQAIEDSGRVKRDCSQNDPSGEPGSHAVEGCPCNAPSNREYCCYLGRGLTCDGDKIWVGFWDGPCNWCGPVSESDASALEAAGDDAGLPDGAVPWVCDEANATAPALVCD